MRPPPSSEADDAGTDCTDQRRTRCARRLPRRERIGDREPILRRRAGCRSSCGSPIGRCPVPGTVVPQAARYSCFTQGL